VHLMHNLVRPSSNNVACLHKTYTSMRIGSEVMWITTQNCRDQSTKFFHFLSSWVHRVLFFAKLLTYNSQIRIRRTELCLMKALSSEWLELE
jgi:hypothetical protein